MKEAVVERRVRDRRGDVDLMAVAKVGDWDERVGGLERVEVVVRV